MHNCKAAWHKLIPYVNFGNNIAEHLHNIENEKDDAKKLCAAALMLAWP